MNRVLACRLKLGLGCSAALTTLNGQTELIELFGWADDLPDIRLEKGTNVLAVSAPG